MIVVEHDEDTMLAADYIVDIGPGAGEHGGQVVASRNGRGDDGRIRNSITGAYLSGTHEDSGAGRHDRKPTGWMTVKGAAGE